MSLLFLGNLWEEGGLKAEAPELLKLETVYLPNLVIVSPRGYVPGPGFF